VIRWHVILGATGDLGPERKFATSIERVSIRVTDTNGPRGGVDQVCSWFHCALGQSQHHLPVLILPAVHVKRDLSTLGEAVLG
jgi:hypothetical protein